MANGAMGQFGCVTSSLGGDVSRVSLAQPSDNVATAFMQRFGDIAAMVLSWRAMDEAVCSWDLGLTALLASADYPALHVLRQDGIDGFESDANAGRLLVVELDDDGESIVLSAAIQPNGFGRWKICENGIVTATVQGVKYGVQPYHFLHQVLSEYLEAPFADFCVT